jgi:chromosome segregation ATPase
MAKLLALGLLSLAVADQVSPIGKVLEMISELETKVIKEGESSHKVFAEFSEWCEDRNRELGFSIKTAEGEVTDLKATIEKETANEEEATAKIEDLAAELGKDESDLKAATEIRDKELADFEAEEAELMEVIDTLKRAIAILERELAKVGGASMLQLKTTDGVVQAMTAMVQASLLSSSDASKLTGLLQTLNDAKDDDDAPDGAPDPAVYKAQTGGIIQTMTDLLDKAEKQLDGLRKAETSNVQNFELLKQGLEDEIKVGNEDLGKTKKALAASQASKAEAEGDLQATTKALNADKDEKATLHSNCMEKAEDFEAEQKSRGEELQALATAKKVIKESTEGAADQTYGDSFVQVESESSNVQVVKVVRELAQKHNSTQLAQLAMRVASAVRAAAKTGEDPFAKVKQLITEMITSLEKEAAADAEHKAFCDKELGENEAKESSKQDEIDKLTSQIDEWTANAALLKEEVAGLEKSLAELAASQQEMDRIREEEKDNYKKDRPELEAGLEGIKTALKVLRDYYSKGDAAHASNDGAGQGIIGLLEVCESDFSKNLAEMISTEEAAQTEYDEQTKANQVDKTNKEQDVKYKTQEAAALEKSTAEAKADRQGVKKELDAVQKVLTSLHEQCDETVVPYEEMQRRRKSEIQGLKQALSILEGEAVLLQQKTNLRRVKLHRA